ncbi:hypothetical protein AB0F43_31895 [Kribbella sp. NPDC023972]|uniref:hypothetical protein n=1 Tax=Kribbella sp. NPDC023972 TaxID=3154795 RepID=UPI0033C73B15
MNTDDEVPQAVLASRTVAELATAYIGAGEVLKIPDDIADGTVAALATEKS